MAVVFGVAMQDGKLNCLQRGLTDQLCESKGCKNLSKHYSLPLHTMLILKQYLMCVYNNFNSDFVKN
jgi:hypothetical protein